MFGLKPPRHTRLYREPLSEPATERMSLPQHRLFLLDCSRGLEVLRSKMCCIEVQIDRPGGREEPRKAQGRYGLAGLNPRLYGWMAPARHSVCQSGVVETPTEGAIHERGYNDRVDLAKAVFQVHGGRCIGSGTFRRAVRRKQVTGVFRQAGGLAWSAQA